MANKRSSAEAAGNKGGNGVFIFAGIFLAVATAAFMFVLFNSFTRTKRVYDETLQSIECISEVNDRLLTINRNLLMIVANVSNTPDDYTNDMDKGFVAIDKSINDYLNVGSHSDLELYRFGQAQLFIDQYKQQIDNLKPYMLAGQVTKQNLEILKNTYLQEVHPVQTTASEMIGATIDIAQLETNDKIRRVQIAFQTAELILLGVAIFGEIAIFIAARISKRNREALAKQAAEIEAATQKFRHTKEKANEMAYLNILTGMKNRYALDNDLSGRLETDQFNIAVFDMDNFRSINDMYGYDFGDEYLAMIGERLKEEYGNDAEIYNITGNEFCFVFNKDVSDIQATRISERVIQTLGEWFTVLNLNVQLTASGSTCHYLPGDSISVSALLVKLDNVLRDAKRNGGNMVLQVVGI